MFETPSPTRSYLGKPGISLILFFILGISASHASEQAGLHWQEIAKRIDEQVTQAETLYRQGKPQEARSTVVKAYFAEFEDSKMEAAMRMEIGAKHTWKVEKLFGRMRKAIKQNAAQEDIAALAEEIRSAIRRDAALLDKAGITPEVFEVNR